MPFQGASRTEQVPSVQDITGLKSDKEDKKEPTVPEMEGYLEKLKHKTNFLVFGWNRRYFKINPKRMSIVYYNSREESNREGGEPSGILSCILIITTNLLGLTMYLYDGPYHGHDINQRCHS